MQLQNPSKLLNCSSVTHENEITKMRCTRLNLQDTYIHLLDSTCKGLVMQLHCETHTHTHTHTLLAQGCVVGSHQHNPFTGDKKG